jgi:hypothetical protein
VTFFKIFSFVDSLIRWIRRSANHDAFLHITTPLLKPNDSNG